MAFISLMLLITLLHTTMSNESKRCLEVTTQLTTSLEATQLFAIGVLGSTLLIITNNEHLIQYIYELPLSQVKSTSLDMTGVAPMKTASKWPFILSNSNAVNITTIKKRLEKNGRALTIMRGGPMLVMPTDYNTHVLLPDFPNLHNLDTISISLDPQWVFVTHFWQNPNEITQLMSGAWISSSKYDRFYVLIKDASTANVPYQLQEYGTFITGIDVMLRQGPTLILCSRNDSGKMKISVELFNPAVSQCKDAYLWKKYIQHGFTDQKWFRLFGTKRVYVFEHRALLNLSEASSVDLIEVPYDSYLTCKETTFPPTSKSVSTLSLIIIIVFVVMAMFIATWLCCCSQKVKASSNITLYSTLSKGSGVKSKLKRSSMRGSQLKQQSNELQAPQKQRKPSKGSFQGKGSLKRKPSN